MYLLRIPVAVNLRSKMSVSSSMLGRPSPLWAATARVCPSCAPENFLIEFSFVRLVGKSTLANILLRIIDYDEGRVLVNGHDIRRYDPAEFHKRVTAVFQGFSKFDASVRENVGIGYFPEMRSCNTIGRAMSLAGADHIVSGLPHGLKTRLDASGSPSLSQFSQEDVASACPRNRPHGLSGGEVSDIIIDLSSSTH